MFDINSSLDFYQKLLDEFDDYYEEQGSARHAINCAITAHHMADWVWGDFLKDDAELRDRLGIKDKAGFMSWIDSKTVWFGLVQGISNGSKHFIRKTAESTQKVQGYGMGGYGQGPYGTSYLTIDMAGDDPALRFMPMAQLLEVVVRFWRDFLRNVGPYKTLPAGRTGLSEP